jgi:hypothetical protein
MLVIALSYGRSEQWWRTPVAPSKNVRNGVVPSTQNKGEWPEGWVNGKLTIVVPLDGVSRESSPGEKAVAAFKRLDPLSELIDDQDVTQTLGFEDVKSNGDPVDPEVPLASIRDRLLSDEIVEKAAGTFQFGRIFEGDRLLARGALEAALDAAFPEEEGK